MRLGLESALAHAQTTALAAQQVIDEGSTDGTVERLEQAGVAVIKASEPHGLTQSWNMVRG